MDYWYLLCSFSWIVVAFTYYKIHKLWHKDVTENNKLYKWDIKVRSFGDLAAIILGIIMSFDYFFKAIG